MKEKLIDKIIKINHVLFFLGCCIVITILAIQLLPRLLEKPYQQPKVELVQHNQKTKQSSEIDYHLKHFAMIQDIQIFQVMSAKILIRNQINSFNANNMFSMGIDEGVTVNILFINSDNISQKLFKQDVYIDQFQLANIVKKKKYISRYEEIFLKNKNIYVVVSSDTDGDGYLSGNDKKDLYISDYNGNDVELAVKDILSHVMIQDNILLIGQEKLNQEVFSTYNLLTGELVTLKTDF